MLLLTVILCACVFVSVNTPHFQTIKGVEVNAGQTATFHCTVNGLHKDNFYLCLQRREPHTHTHTQPHTHTHPHTHPHTHTHTHTLCLTVPYNHLPTPIILTTTPRAGLKTTHTCSQFGCA